MYMTYYHMKYTAMEPLGSFRQVNDVSGDVRENHRELKETNSNAAAPQPRSESILSWNCG